MREFDFISDTDTWTATIIQFVKYPKQAKTWQVIKIKALTEDYDYIKNKSRYR